ncbi:MAG: hypothetical protein J1D77_08640 [Muribaculaceae bacterium]|nr:hypothetical protein [Muribaculaceae bacterium]
MISTFKQLAIEVATILGEPLLPDCQPEESPFPGIENRVRILSPSLLASLIFEKADKEGILEVPDSLYAPLLEALSEKIRT